MGFFIPVIWNLNTSVPKGKLPSNELHTSKKGPPIKCHNNRAIDPSIKVASEILSFWKKWDHRSLKIIIKIRYKNSDYNHFQTCYITKMILKIIMSIRSSPCAQLPDQEHAIFFHNKLKVCLFPNESAKAFRVTSGSFQVYTSFWVRQVKLERGLFSWRLLHLFMERLRIRLRLVSSSLSFWYQLHKTGYMVTWAI